MHIIINKSIRILKQYIKGDFLIMKYNYLNQIIPQEKRKDLNKKVLTLIRTNQCEKYSISKEDIYNAYTGEGGLHGLRYNDYANYHDYSNAKKEIENGQFFTPHVLSKFIIDCLNLKNDDIIADLTCGMGAFFNFIPTESNAYGCEIDRNAFDVAKFLYPNANITCGDLRNYKPNIRFDYVVGNPPYNLQFKMDGYNVLSQLYYCEKAAELLKPFGIMAIIVPESFLSDTFHDKKMIEQLEENFSFLGQISLDKDTFKNLGVVGYKTKIQFWQKKGVHKDFINSKYSTVVNEVVINHTGVEFVRDNFLKNAQEFFYKNKASIILQLNRESDDNDDFAYKVKRDLYIIKTHPLLKDKYNKCCEYINRYYEQKQPEGMSYEEWCKVRITKNKVLVYLKNMVRKQNPKETNDIVRLVKNNYGLKLKAYSKKMAKQITDNNNIDLPIYKIIAEGHNASDYGCYRKFIKRKQNMYNIEQIPFEKMSQNCDIEKWINSISFYDSAKEKIIKPNEIQKHDLNLILQKRYSLLQWEQGAGKTLAGIITSKYRMEKQNVYCACVVSTALSIKNNWNLVLGVYGIPYVMLQKLSDIKSIRKGQFVLMTFGFLSKYKKHIKKWVKMHNQNISLCLDESDEITNPTSIKTRAVLDVFRRIKYKLLMTGTSIRNNISEFFSQLELSYNNSANMISWCYSIYKNEKANEKKGIEEGLNEYSNPYYGKPIPAYQKGYKLFSHSHLPEKITVFGVGKKTQDIYNADILSDIIKRFVITRSLAEIRGEDIRNIHQIPVVFNPEERAVYQKAVSEFYSMRNNYFASTGNSRKDSLMQIIQQITLLLRISAAPDTVLEYNGGTPTKMKKIIELLNSKPNEIVVIGVRHKLVVDAYAKVIKELLPNRKLFIVTGSTTTFKERRDLKEKLRDSKNGILLCTQQSLSSSVNFEYVDTVIIPELHYNNSRMSQFYDRFVRYDSVNKKNIYFVTYADSIESNQMQMVLTKERLNSFMKDEDVDLDEIYNKFGVDYNLMSMLMTRETDEKGYSYLKWGEQTLQKSC